MTCKDDRRRWHGRAMALAGALYADNVDIDWELADIIGCQIDAIAAELDFDEDYRRGCRSHRFRIAVSIQELKDLLRPGARVLELGGTTYVTHLLMAQFPQVDWHTSSWDLRLRWPTEAESYDVAISMEVLEHLSDPEDRQNEQLELRGLRTCLQECRRTLCPGGVLFATTPNSASIHCLQAVLGGATGMYYWPHIREYCREEITQELEGAGFEIDSLRAVHCLALDQTIDYTPVFRLLLELGYPTEDRGDDWFIRARRPLVVASEPEAS